MLVSPNDDKEIRSEIVSLKICISDPKIGCHRFSKFSSWKSLVKAFSFLRYKIDVWYWKCIPAQLDCLCNNDKYHKTNSNDYK
jgi:hypothetical protein